MSLDILQKKRIGKILFWFISFIVFALFFWQKNAEIVILQEKNKELLKILKDNNIKMEEKKVEKKSIKKEDVEIENNENNDKKQNP